MARKRFAVVLAATLAGLCVCAIVAGKVIRDGDGVTYTLAAAEAMDSADAIPPGATTEGAGPPADAPRNY